MSSVMTVRGEISVTASMTATPAASGVFSSFLSSKEDSVLYRMMKIMSAKKAQRRMSFRGDIFPAVLASLSANFM